MYKNQKTTNKHNQTLVLSILIMPLQTAFIEMTLHIKSLCKSFAEAKATVE